MRLLITVMNTGAWGLLALVCWLSRSVKAFAPYLSRPPARRSTSVVPFQAVRKKKLSLLYDDDDDDDDDESEDDRTRGGQVGTGPNWIERDFPNQPADAKAVEDYSVGIDGDSFATGELSKHMHDAIVSRSSFDTADPDIQRALKLYAMDFTAKEAVRASLTQNGLEFVTYEDKQDEGEWGEVDSVRFDGKLYDSWEDAVDSWTPGTTFSFVARHVPAKMAELSVDLLLQALDPDGALREEAKQTGQAILPDEEISTLLGLVALGERRIARAPIGVDDEPFTGNGSRGYRVLPVANLMVTPPTADTVYHVMEALVSHGCLVVELEEAALEPMWQAVEDFFEYVDTSPDFAIPALAEAPGLPAAAKVGYANYEDSEFLELRPTQGRLLPSEVETVLDNSNNLLTAFHRIVEVSKSVVTIVVAASTEEAGILDDAWASSALLAEELIDDGTEGRSPHRLCRYRTNRDGVTFGAHTDSTFITAVPVSGTPGLEVYDDDAQRWLRPEAQFINTDHQQQQQQQPPPPPEQLRRHVILMPGELLQIASRDEVQASVHRVICTTTTSSTDESSRKDNHHRRLSAPILLRGRNRPLDCDRYLGGTSGWELLKACNGRTMDDIHQELQQPFR